MIEYDADIEERKPYVVFLRSSWDDHDRLSIRLRAYGPKDAANLAEDLHQGYLAARVEEAAA